MGIISFWTYGIYLSTHFLSNKAKFFPIRRIFIYNLPKIFDMIYYFNDDQVQSDLFLIYIKSLRKKDFEELFFQAIK